MHLVHTSLLVTFAAVGMILTAGADHIVPATMTSKEAARYLGVHVNTLYRLMADGSVRHIRIRGAVRFRKADLDEYLDTLARGGAPRTR